MRYSCADCFAYCGTYCGTYGGTDGIANGIANDIANGITNDPCVILPASGITSGPLPDVRE